MIFDLVRQFLHLTRSDAQFIEIIRSFVCTRLLREIDYSVTGRRNILSETIALIGNFGQILRAFFSFDFLYKIMMLLFSLH